MTLLASLGLFYVLRILCRVLDMRSEMKEWRRE